MVVAGIRTMELVKVEHYHYSIGLPSATCFFMAIIYITISVVVLVRNGRYINRHKQIGIITYILTLVFVPLARLLRPELYLTSIGATIFVLGVYLNIQSPAIKKIEEFQVETMMGFATLIESRDRNTGGHIKRTRTYVKMIADKLSAMDIYTNVLTKDYIRCLEDAAPMHDVGKIAIPDSILQKPGKLTQEEYEIIKQHAEIGGMIIRETFNNMGDDKYQEIAYEVARYHHEKWDGTGYPEGLKGPDIPLCARIMAVADVFDAVSEQRCYRDALPLEQCFQVIADGRGTAFDPVIVDAFFTIEEDIRHVHALVNANATQNLQLK